MRTNKTKVNFINQKENPSVLGKARLIKKEKIWNSFNRNTFSATNEKIPNSTQKINFEDIKEVCSFETNSVECPTCGKIWVNPQNITIKFNGGRSVTHIGSYCNHCQILRISPSSKASGKEKKQNIELLSKLNTKGMCPPTKNPTKPTNNNQGKKKKEKISFTIQEKEQIKVSAVTQKQTTNKSHPKTTTKNKNENKTPIKTSQCSGSGGTEYGIYYYRTQYSNAQLPSKIVQPKDRSTEISNKLDSLQRQEISYDDTILKRSYIELEQKPFTHKAEQVIYLGIDFGTSYTKVAYQKDANNRSILAFGDTYFKNSILFYNTKSYMLSFFQPDNMDKVEKIQFFKATTIDNEKSFEMLKNQHLTLPNNTNLKKNFSLLCSAFFLANIIKYCTMFLRDKFNCSPELFISLGVPLLETDENLTLYNKALHLAIELANKQESISQINLETLFNISEESWAHFNNDDYKGELAQNCTMPEIFAESLYLLGQKNYGPGYYLIVDIGGGTADFAFIHKDNSFDKSFKFYCPSALVKPLGNEIRKVYESLDGSTYHTEFGNSYSCTISKSKTLLQLADEKNFVVQRLLFGGGAIEKDKPYQKKEKQNFYTQNLKGVSHKLQYRDFDNYQNPFIPDSLGIKPEDRQRLIIATQLANPNSRTKHLNGTPINYSKDQTEPRKKKPLGNPGYDSIG